MDMQYIDLQPFEDFGRSRHLVDQTHLSFYSNWVLRFLSSEFDREKLNSRDLLQCFSDQLARDNSLEDWQRRQAMTAVELYLHVFLPEANGMAHGAEGVPPAVQNGAGGTPAAQGGEWNALPDMKDLLKLRHYSPRTLQTYEDWVKQFFRYASFLFCCPKPASEQPACRCSAPCADRQAGKPAPTIRGMAALLAR
jgi:hypothetical protein